MSEKVTIKVERKELHLPTIALRGLVVFPNNLVHFEVGREKSIAAVEWAMANNSNVFLVAQKEMETSEPTQQDLYTYGVVAEVKQVLRVSDELVKVLVEGKYRAKLTELDTTGDFLLSAVRSAPVRAAKPEEAVETEALLRALKTGFDEYLGMNPRLAKDVVFTIVSSDDPMFLTEYMPANLLFRYEDKQAVMNENTLNGRLQHLVEMLRRECQVMKIEKEIAEKVNESMDKNQRDYYLHEQLHIINDELGEGDDTHAEADDYRRKIRELHLAEDSEKKLLKEVDRLSRMQSSNQEATVIRTYLDTCLDLPWNTMTVDDLDIHRAQQILDRDHYGLKKVKDRILETLAVRKLAPDVKAQIICLGWPSGCRQNQHRTLHRRKPWPQVCAHQSWRRAGRSRDPRPPPHLHRCHARQDHQRHDHRQVLQPFDAAGRDRQAGRGLPGRPGGSSAGSAGPGAEQHLQRSFH